MFSKNKRWVCLLVIGLLIYYIKQAKDSMRILIFNWRDIKNPSSGGAEILTHELAKYLIKKKNEVTLFTSKFEGSSGTEDIDGVTIIREGYSIARYFFNSVHYLAFKRYRKHFKGKIDLVIDEVHGFPFFTPWYVKEKKVVLVCEVAGNLWIKMFGLFFGTIGRMIEIFYLRFTYSAIPFITISNSAEKDLVRNGVNRKNITVIPVGVSIPRILPKINREKNPTIIFLGRVSRSKGIEDVIPVMNKLSAKYEIKMWVCGRQDPFYKKELHELVRKNDLDSKITFFDYITEEEKFNLLSRSWILFHPSKTEGWGINVIEANSMGVPAVGYNVPGLQDSIKNGKTGLLAKENAIDGLTEMIERLIVDTKLYKQLSKEAIEWSKNFTWEKTGEKTWKILKKIYEE